MKKLHAAIRGAVEFRQQTTTHYPEGPLAEAYDRGREFMHVVTFRRFEDGGGTTKWDAAKGKVDAMRREAERTGEPVLVAQRYVHDPAKLRLCKADALLVLSHFVQLSLATGAGLFAILFVAALGVGVGLLVLDRAF